MLAPPVTGLGQFRSSRQVRFTTDRTRIGAPQRQRTGRSVTQQERRFGLEALGASRAVFGRRDRRYRLAQLLRFNGDVHPGALLRQQHNRAGIAVAPAAV